MLPAPAEHWADIPIDLVTCYGGLPKGLAPEPASSASADYAPKKRRELIWANSKRMRLLRTAGMICSTEAIMTKWKWMLACERAGQILHHQ